MPDPTQPVVPSQDPALKRLWVNLQQRVPDFTVDYDTFSKDMEQGDNLRALHTSLQERFPNDFTIAYEVFEADMGVKKKPSGNGAGLSSSADPFNTALQTNDVAAGVGEDMPAGTPMSAPADVNLPATGADEQVPQPLGMSLPTQGSGQFDNPLELEQQAAALAGQGDPFGQIQPGRNTGVDIKTYDSILKAGQEVDDEARGKRNFDVQQQLFAGMVANQRERDGAAGNAWNEQHGLQGLADFSSSFYNALVPGGARALAAAVDYVDNLTAATGLQGAGMQFMQQAGAKKPLGISEPLRNFAANNQSYVSKQGREELAKDWTNPRAWASALGSGGGSIAAVALAGATTGGVGALATGTAMGLDETEQAADAAGLTANQKLAMQSVVAPLVGLLEEAGLGTLVENPVTRQLIGRSILAGAAGKLERTALVKAASKFAPKLVEVAAQVGKQGVSEGTTEGLQTLVAEAYKLAFDAAQGNDGKKEGGGSFGTLENGLGEGLLNAGKAAATDAAVGGVLGGLLGGDAGNAATQQAEAVPAEAQPTEAPAPEPTAAPEELPLPEAPMPPTPAVKGQRVAQLKSGETLLADFAADGTAIRAYTESGQEFSLEDPAVRAKIEEAGAVSLQQPTSQANGTEPQPAPQLESGRAASELDTAQPPTPASLEGAPVVEQGTESGIVSNGVPAELPGASAQPDATSSGELTPSLPGSQELDSVDEPTSPAEEPASAQEAPAQPVAATPRLTPEQERVNGVLDSLDNYKQLSTRDQKSKKGQAARAELAQLAEAAGLDFAVGNDLSVKVTKGGKRVTRTNAITGTSPIEGHIPARNRAPEVRDAALQIANRVLGGGGEFVAIGVQVNGKRLNPRDAKAAAQDIVEGRNTYRADALLNALEQAQQTGFVEVSTGTGLATQKERIPFEDYLGNPDPATIRSKQPVELSDSDIDSLIAEDTSVQEAINAYANEDGSIDFARMAADVDPQGGSGVFQFMFGVNEETADKLLALANERANQTTQEGTDARSQASGVPQPASLPTGSQEPAPAQEVAPKKPSLREQNVAAKQELSDALAEFKAARKKKVGKAYSSAVGFAPFSEEEAAAIVKAVKALVKLGYTNSKLVVAELRGIGFDEDDATDAQLLPAVKQVLKDEGVFKAKAKAATEAPLTDAAKQRKSMQRLTADPTTPAALTERITDTSLDRYEPRSLADAEAEAGRYLQRVSLDEAFARSLTPAGDMHVYTALRIGVLNALNTQTDAALTNGDEARALALHDQAYTLAEAIAKRGTEAGQEINAYKLLARHSPAAVVVAAQKEVRQQREKKAAQVNQKGKQVAVRARKVQKEAVAATLASPAVAKAKQAVGAKSAPTPAKEAIQKIRATRADLLAELRKLNGTIGIVSPQQRIAELHVAIFRTYISEGMVRVKDLVARIRREAGPALSGATEADLTARASTALSQHQAKTNDAKAAVERSIRELGIKLDEVVRLHATQQDETGRTLAEKLVAEAGLLPADAATFAAAVEAEFAKQVAARRNTILDRLHTKLGAILPKRNTKTALEKLLGTLNLSPITDQRVTEVLQDQLDLPQLTAQDVQNLRKLAEAVQTAPEGYKKTAAVTDLLAAQGRIKGMTLIDLANAAWYAHGLSGPKTHGINIYTAGLAVLEENLVSFLYQVGRTKGNVVKAAASFRGVTGFAKGARDASYIMQTGYDVYSDYKVDAPNELEVYKPLDPDSYQGIRKLWAYASKYPVLLRYIGRALRAEDAFFTGGAKEMRAWEYAMMQADRENKGQPTKAIIEKAHELLYGTKDRMEEAEATARAEGLTGRDLKRRTVELMEESRPAEMKEDNLRWARRTVFNSEPKGTLGAFATLLGKAGRLSVYGFRPLMFIVPYTRVPANIANRSLEYTPVGYVRALKGGIGFNNETYGTYFDPYSPEERAKASIRATLGLATIGLFYALSHDKDDEGEPALEIVGYGPRDFTKRQEWMQNGGMPYSVRKRGSKTFVTYQGWPNAAALVAAGTIRDMEQFEGKTWADRSFADKALLLMVKQAQYNMNLTSSRGLYDALDAFNNPNSDALVKYGNRLAGNSAKNFVLPAAFTQASKTAQSVLELPKKEVDGALDVLVQDIPFARRGLVDGIDALGDPIQVDTDRLYSSPSPRPAASQAIWDVLLKRRIFISLPDRRTLTIVDVNTKTESYATPQQYHDFLQKRGEYIKLMLPPTILQGLAKAPRAEAQKFLNREIVTRANKAAKLAVFGSGAFVKLPEADE